MRALRPLSVIAVTVACFTTSSPALVVDFTGGVVTRLDTSLETTNNTVVWDNVDYYEESGFRFDFIPNSGSAGFSTHLGNYYGPFLNDVIHSHWVTGDFGGVVLVEITRSAGGPFDMDSFLLTSNTEFGGTAASGNEAAFVQGYFANVPTGPAVLMPSEDWGFPGTTINFGTDFDNVDKVTVMVANHVDCFGMDDFVLTEVPEPAGGAALLGAIACTAASRRRRAECR